MGFSVIFGKPGSGKTYHCVGLISKRLCDWYERERAGQEVKERLYTNLPLNINAINDHMADQYGSDKGIDVSKYIILLDNDYYTPPVPLLDDYGLQCKDANGKLLFRYWWDKFPQDAFIVLDEVHKLLGAELTEVSTAELVSGLRDWVSTYRHSRQDIVFLTQAPENIHRSVLAMADSGMMITNPKYGVFPFPFNIPMSDVEAVLKAFGVTRQYYTVQYGTYRGRSIRFSGAITRHIMSPVIYRLYQSTTLVSDGIGGDKVRQFSSRFAACWWFFRRHAWHLSLKLAVVIFLAGLSISLFKNFPHIVFSSVKMVMPKSDVMATGFDDIKSSSDNKQAKNIQKTNEIYQEAPVSGPMDVFVDEDYELSKYPRVTAYFPDGFYTSEGNKYSVGDELDFLDDDKEVKHVEKIDYRSKSIEVSGGSVYPRDFVRVQHIKMVPPLPSSSGVSTPAADGQTGPGVRGDVPGSGNKFYL